MKTAVALVVVMMLAGVVAAQPAATTTTFDADVHTRKVIDRHARSARNGRIFGGVAALVFGAAIGIGGYALVATAEPGGFIDFSPVQRFAGYFGMVAGGLLVVTSPVVLLSKTEQEKFAARSLAHGDMARARGEVALKAAEGRRVRRNVRIAGGVFVGLGLAAATTGVLLPESVDGDTQAIVVATGLATTAIGGGVLAASLIDTPYENMHQDLRVAAPQLSAGLVPTRGGALVGVGGSF